MIVGFTGTQRGMTREQLAEVATWLRTNRSRVTEAHHGDCIGADEQFHDLCIAHRIPTIVIHPPEDSSKRAWCELKATNLARFTSFVEHQGVYVMPERDYLGRDQAIVEACDVLLATPKGVVPNLRSGTWYTLRYAIKLHRQYVAIGPQGQLLEPTKQSKATNA